VPDYSGPPLDHAAVVADMRRSLNAFWADIGEAPVVYFVAGPLDEDNAHKTMRGLEHYAPEFDPDGEVIAQAVSQRLFPHFERFFQEASLQPGTYTVAIGHLREPEIGGLDGSVANMRFVKIPLAETMQFTVTQDHIKLVKTLRFRDLGGALGTHDKRPYGSSSYFYPDMAYALGVDLDYGPDGSLSDADNARYARLHEEMLLVLQAFWQHAEP